MTLFGIERLIERVEGPLPVRYENGDEVWRLDLTRDERNELAEALYAAQKATLEAERRTDERATYCPATD